MNYENLITKFVTVILYSDQEILEKHEAAKQELKHIHEAVRGREAMFRSRMKWFELGEKPTKFFFNLEKK